MVQLRLIIILYLLGHDTYRVEGVSFLLPLLHTTHQIYKGLCTCGCLVLGRPARQLEHLHNTVFIHHVGHACDVLKSNN